jgi:hypothetical protein
MKGERILKKACISLLVSCLALLALAGQALARDSLLWLTYDMAIPMGDLEEFTADTSFRGWSLEYRNLVRDRLSVGISVSWQGFSEREDGTFTEGTITATGTQIRYMHSYPIMATGHLYTGDYGGFRIYGGLGVGAFYMNERFDFGIHSYYSSHWHFGVVPEAGLMIPVGYRSNIVGNVRYNYAFKTSDEPTYSYWGFNVGIAAYNW